MAILDDLKRSAKPEDRAFADIISADPQFWGLSRRARVRNRIKRAWNTVQAALTVPAVALVCVALTATVFWVVLSAVESGARR